MGAWVTLKEHRAGTELVQRAGGGVGIELAHLPCRPQSTAAQLLPVAGSETPPGYIDLQAGYARLQARYIGLQARGVTRRGGESGNVGREEVARAALRRCRRVGGCQAPAAHLLRMHAVACSLSALCGALCGALREALYGITGCTTQGSMEHTLMWSAPTPRSSSATRARSTPCPRRHTPRARRHAGSRRATRRTRRGRQPLPPPAAPPPATTRRLRRGPHRRAPSPPRSA